jgi:hypothetical protein
MCEIIQIGAVEQSLQDLELRRKDLFRQLENLGDFRRGTISVNYRKCGKSNCVCARKDHLGHGPQYLWNVSINGKTQARNLPLGPELEKAEVEVERYRAFVRLSQELVEVNDRICQLGPAGSIDNENELEQLKKNCGGISPRNGRRNRPSHRARPAGSPANWGAGTWKPAKCRSALTREVKIGCVFTQTKLNEEGYPIRDEDSTTYVGAIETAESFGPRIYAEAVRRGLRQALKVVVLGDGGPWIWGIAALYFPWAIEIVDLYHAREHLANLGKVVYGPTSAEAKRWSAARSQQLDAGDVEAVITSMRRLRPRQDNVREEVRKAIDYFQTNKDRMRYAKFRSEGLFVGSGVVEAGCKAVIGLRLKQSGMRWTVSHANAIIALRCCQLSGRWEEFWEQRSVA